MALDSTIEVLGHTNLKAVAESPAWAASQRQLDIAAHGGRNDRYAELAYQNAVAHQNLANQSALDHQNGLRGISQMFMGALANKFINQDVEQAIADSQVMKGNSDSNILSILGSLGGGQIGAKIAQSTPPTSASDTGVAGLMTMMNTLNQQNYSNNTTNSSLAATMTAIAAILAKNVTNTPPMGSGDAK